ncbi:MAG: type 4a pilus biogenesis protein PilO [Desulfobulbaceae bacterium]|uniref:Type 4a pilus biogenesis protein PilO n=1 Tax=Candidatus Desulfobia pelagia TaxID=2841692 RepID=A0A8J6NF49_9BACT|nr:type 4a pilus biogenesis protein PilO [Candidatus Desulfobia pelagia]
MSPKIAQIQESLDQFVDKTSGLSAKHKILICVAAVIIPAVAFYFFVYTAKSEEITKLTTKQSKLQQEVRRVEKVASKIEQHRAEMAETKELFTQASSLLPQKQEIPSLLTSISDQGTNSGLDFLSFTPKQEVQREFYAEIPVDIKVRGPYHNVGVFLDKISKLPRIVNVDNITMGGPKQEAGEMMLNTGFKLVTYRFIEPSEQAASQQANQKKGRKRK